MSPFEIATAAHLAGTLVLVLLFVLLERHDPRPYLGAWLAAWVAQALALGTLLVTGRRDWQVGFSLYLFLETAHGVLLCLAALSYARASRIPRLGLVFLAPVALWSAAGPLALEGRALHAAQFGVLGLTYLAAAAILWRLREGGRVMGLRLTSNVLVLLGLLYAVHASVSTWTVRADAGPYPYLEAIPFTLLLLQMLLAFGMVLTVMEAAQHALDITNAQLQEAKQRLENLAQTDPLTGAYNRRVFRALVDDLRAEGPERAHGVVLMLDMDALKAINDRGGHGEGDAAIRAVADAIRTRIRTTDDLLVRWGGDEFVVVLPGASVEEGEVRRGQIVEAVAEAGQSVSAGLAPYGAGADIVDAVQTADAAMYAHKAARKAARAAV